MPLAAVTDDSSAKPLISCHLEENPSVLTPNMQKVQWHLREQIRPVQPRIALRMPGVVDTILKGHYPKLPLLLCLLSHSQTGVAEPKDPPTDSVMIPSLFNSSYWELLRQDRDLNSLNRDLNQFGALRIKYFHKACMEMQGEFQIPQYIAQKKRKIKNPFLKGTPPTVFHLKIILKLREKSLITQI